MAVSPLYVSPRAKTISPLGRMSSCHSVLQQCCPLTLLKPSPKALTFDPTLSGPGILFLPRGCGKNDTEQQAQWQAGHFRLHYLLAGHSSTAFLRQNGNTLSVVLISLILISFLSGHCLLTWCREKQQLHFSAMKSDYHCVIYLYLFE